VEESTILKSRAERATVKHFAGAKKKSGVGELVKYRTPGTEKDRKRPQQDSYYGCMGDRRSFTGSTRSAARSLITLVKREVKVLW